MLKKLLYGLKHYPKQWYKRSVIAIFKANIIVFVYFKKLFDGSFIYLFLYVDDMLIAAKNTSKINKLKAKLNGEFDMKDLGAAKKILGMVIKRNRYARKLYLTEKSFVKKVLECFGTKIAKLLSTPFVTHLRLSTTFSP